jgi:DNA-binding transcriptional LysR family regulator
VIPTPAGTTLRLHAERVIAAVEEAEAALGAELALTGGAMTIAVFRGSSYYPVGDAVAMFLRRHASVRVTLHGQNSSEAADAVRSRDVEAAIVVLPIDDRSLDVRPLMRDEVVVVGPERHGDGPVTRDGLAGARRILYDADLGWNDPTRRQLARRAQERRIRLEPVVEVDRLEAAIQLADRSVGDTIAPRTVMESPWFPRSVRARPFAEPLYDTHAIITRRGAPLSPAMREFLAVTEEMYERRRTALAHAA